MARIITYTTDDEINPEDKVIGTDGKEGVNFGKTKNFTIGGLTSYLSAEAAVEGPAGADGADGADGDSAYQIWLDAGNTGTEQDFLDSLVGADGVAGGVSSIIAGSNVTIDPISGVGDVTVSSPDAIVNTEDTFTSTPKITNIVSLTEAEYTALSVKENDTLYILI